MQAIARANRIYAEKTNGLVVDYIGILKNLRDALIEFTGKKGDTELLSEHFPGIIKLLTHDKDGQWQKWGRWR